MLNTRKLHALLLGLTTGLLLTACGGGGGGAGTAPTAGAPPSLPNTGSVGIIFTDADTDQFDEILATISSIELKGDSGDATIFTGSETIDFLKLASFTELFAVAEDVPAGDYNKIRLILDDLTLVRNDANGDPLESVSVRLPGNGKVDLNPRQTFFVNPGSTLLLEIDLDARKSIKVTKTGNGDRYQFRPVVFVKVREGSDDGGKLARVFGTVQSVDADAQTFVLCQDGYVSDSDDDSDGDDRSDDQKDNCLTVNVFDDTGIFDTDGEPAEFSAIMLNDPLTAIGRLSVSDETPMGDAGDDDGDSDEDGDSDSSSDMDDDGDSDGDSDSDAGFDDDDLVLDAAVIELGDLGTFERLKGTIATDLASDEFQLDIAPGQGFGDDSSVTAVVQMGTRIFNVAGDELTDSALVSGAMGHFEGVLMLSNADPDTLKTALIVLDDMVSDAGETIIGDILSVDVADRSLRLATATMERCVAVPETTDITLVTIDSTGSNTETVALGDLTNEMSAEVFGREGDGGCFVAETIRAELEVIDGNRAPIAAAGPDQPVTTGDTVMLDGSGSSDPDGDALTYSWSLTVPAGSSAALDDPNSAMPSFVADVDGEYQAELVVNDGTIDSGGDTVRITASTASTLDGAMLYETNCQRCHDPLANSEKAGATAEAIQDAIDRDVGDMGTLSDLTPDEVAAIADALR